MFAKLLCDSLPKLFELSGVRMHQQGSSPAPTAKAMPTYLGV